jgi:hypothetical protein
MRHDAVPGGDNAVHETRSGPRRVSSWPPNATTSSMIGTRRSNNSGHADVIAATPAAVETDTVRTIVPQQRGARCEAHQWTEIVLSDDVQSHIAVAGQPALERLDPPSAFWTFRSPAICLHCPSEENPPEGATRSNSSQSFALVQAHDRRQT